jgi:hypothetical protein
VKTFVRQAKVIQMVAKYNSKVLIPLLLTIFQFQNLGIKPPSELVTVDDDDSIFGVVTSNEDTIHGLLKNELILFHHLHVKPEDYALPFTWWQSHEIRFPYVSFVARQILGILGSQIEIKRIFNIARVLTSLWCCGLGVDNLDKLFMIMKN